MAPSIKNKELTNIKQEIDLPFSTVPYMKVIIVKIMRFR